MGLQARPYWPHILGIFVLSLLSTPLALLTPLPLKIVIDNVIGSRPLPGFLIAIVPSSTRHSRTRLLAIAVGLLVRVTLLTPLHNFGQRLPQTYARGGTVVHVPGPLFGHF